MSSHTEPQPLTWWHLFGRPIAAYVLASVAAGCFIGMVTLPFLSGADLIREMSGSLAFGLMWSPFIAVIAALPSITALVIAKALVLPRGITDAIAGGLIGAVMITLLVQLMSSSGRLDGTVMIEALRFGAAGVVGGYVYWLTNGRPQNRQQMEANSRQIDFSIFD